MLSMLTVGDCSWQDLFDREEVFIPGLRGVLASPFGARVFAGRYWFGNMFKSTAMEHC